MCCVIFAPNGRKTALRLIEGAAKEFCRNNNGYTYAECREVESIQYARQVEYALSPPLELHESVPLSVPDYEDRLLEAQRKWAADPRIQKRRQYLERQNPTEHYLACAELLQRGVYECKHFECKCWCHNNASARAQCLYLSKQKAVHDQCLCSCHATA